MSKLRHEKGDAGLNAASGLQKTTPAAPGPSKARRSPQSLPSFYTIGQVAEALGVSTRTVRRWIAAPHPRCTGSTAWCASPIAISSDFWPFTGRDKAVPPLSWIVTRSQWITSYREYYMHADDPFML